MSGSLFPIVAVEDIAASDPGAIAIGPFGSAMKADLYTEAGVPVVRGNNIGPGRSLQGGFVFVSEVTADRLKRSILQPADIFFPHRGAIGEVGFVTQDHATPLLMSSSLMRLRVDRMKADPEYVFWFFKSLNGRKELLRYSSTVGTPGIGQPLSSLRAMRVPMPPLHEQREIAAILGALDDKIEVNRKASATLEEMARALYRSWFVDFDPVWAKLEGRQPAHMDAATAALFPDSFDDDGLPVGWESAPYLDFVEIVSGGTPKTSTYEYWGGDIPWYSVVDAPAPGQVFVHQTEKNISPLGFENSAVKLVPRGTTIISARGTVGKIAMAGCDMVFNQSCYGLRGKREQTDAFVYFATERGVEQLQSMAHGSVFATITRKTFEGLELAGPPISLMNAYEAVSSVWLDRIHALGLESRTIATLRDTILPRLMSGELRVGEARELVEEVA
ncbi:restriction endonuclease subunit S [Paenirhodobacter populi]|uniref:Restriction endonuclease subunit S n=1 Tax=Paenirhodobacter populi TaxID=2306993 RepID=A0A443IKP0_9RHOB|nr:restriction endonuclease subunit S [Sinirhodobacter populi]RWR05299.1 restriction endonuclease subunit S [Sinirhodobacter populi]